MGGMKLGFIKNAVQKIAAHKNIPVHYLEAVIVYGTPAQRAKALSKITEASSELSLHKETYQLVLAVCTTGDATKRCELLYALRGKIRDLARNRFGNIVMQKLIDGVPQVQRKEIAEALGDEIIDLSRHPFGNHVIQKLVQFEASRELVELRVYDDLDALAQHPVAQHVVAACIKAGAEGISRKCADSVLIKSLLALKESAVLTELCRLIPENLQSISQQVRSVMREHLHQFCEEGSQHFALVAAVEACGDDELALWLEELAKDAQSVCKTKGTSAVLASAVLRIRGVLVGQYFSLVCSAFEDVLAAAKDPYASLVLRSLIAAELDSIPDEFIDRLASEAADLSKNPASSVILQRLLQFPRCRDKIFEAVTPALGEIVDHSSGSHVVQALLDVLSDEDRSIIARVIVPRAAVLANDPHGTFTLQKVIAVCDTSDLIQICDALGDDVVKLSKDSKGCFAVAALLQACKKHGLQKTKDFMDTLKSHVTTLAVMPWSGRIVLDAMFLVGSSSLKEAVKNVIFLKCEAFLSDVPQKGPVRRRPQVEESAEQPKKRLRVH